MKNRWSVHVKFSVTHLFLLGLGLGIIAPNALFAEDVSNCPVTPSVLVHSCKADISVRLRILPDEIVQDSAHLLTVAGTYSSGDRFGIEGLVIRGGEIVSRRYQNWDGVLVIDADGTPELYHAADVELGTQAFDLKDKPSRMEFIKLARDTGVAVLQSHLLVSNGSLDLKDVEDAPKFKRRLLVTFEDDSFGVWETTQAETLYAAAHQVQAELNPKMALNLDMGAYDYCRSGPKGEIKDCGRLLVSADKLTNVLEFRKR